VPVVHHEKRVWLFVRQRKTSASSRKPLSFSETHRTFPQQRFALLAYLGGFVKSGERVGLVQDGLTIGEEPSLEDLRGECSAFNGENVNPVLLLDWKSGGNK
jgi:hypothetical protein